MSHVLRLVKSVGVDPRAQIALQRRPVTGASEHGTELKLVPCFKSIMETNLNYILSEHVCSSKVTRIAGFSSTMLRHTEIKVCSMFHLLYTCNLSPQIFDCFCFQKKVSGCIGTPMKVVILSQFD